VSDQDLLFSPAVVLSPVVANFVKNSGCDSAGYAEWKMNEIGEYGEHQ
jgi:hypothetical protein